MSAVLPLDELAAEANRMAAQVARAPREMLIRTKAKAIRRRWEDLKSVTEGFVATSEEGKFDVIKQEAATREAK